MPKSKEIYCARLRIPVLFVDNVPCVIEKVYTSTSNEWIIQKITLIVRKYLKKVFRFNKHEKQYIYTQYLQIYQEEYLRLMNLRLRSSLKYRLDDFKAEYIHPPEDISEQICDLYRVQTSIKV